ncbi:MAG: CehA/McbA family metallohydrolase, partial [Peptococcaceae bacterium]|nr:CehA/McbA family metallohydrolase [Peptococcaceae bacterium]
YTVTEAINLQDARVAAVQGFIVGQPTAASTVLTAGFPNDYALALADTPTETDPGKMLYVQIPSSFRAEFGLNSNPANLGQSVKVTGSLTPYFTPHPGLKAVSDIVAVPTAAQPTILDARNLFAANKDNTTAPTATVTGVVTYSDGKNFYIQDNTAGINVYVNGLSPLPQQKDVITATGPMVLYNGLLEVKPATTGASIVGSVPELPVPKEVSLDQVENYESQLIKIANVTLGTTVGNNTPLTDAANNTINIYKMPPLSGISPGDKVDVVAIASVFTKPQLLVQNASDITKVVDTVDNSPPEIVHTPVTTATAGKDLTVSARVTDATQVTGVKLYFRPTGQTTYATLTMSSGLDADYSATIPGTAVTSAGLQYYIEATDGANTGTSPVDAANPYAVTVNPETEPGPYNFYFGNLHSHTNLSDGLGTPDDAFTYARDTAKVDFLAITDHSNWFDNNTTATLADGSQSKSWQQLKSTADKYNNAGSFVAIGGYEMTWADGTGHINTFNTDGFLSRNAKGVDLKTYYAGIAKYPQSISQLNHPGTIFGDFDSFNYHTPEADNVVDLIEVGNGEGQVRSGGYFPSYEYYTEALDKGWHVAPSNNQDNHLGKWGNANAARTVVLAQTLDRNSIYTAIREHRVYATEDQNLRVNYTVNGSEMGASLDNPSQLNISINLDDPDQTDVIGKVSIIANGGTVVATKSFTTNTAQWDLTLPAQYSYYYVRVDEGDQDIAVTAPVWTAEVPPAGISMVAVSQNPLLVNSPVDLTATVYNNGVDPLSNVTVQFFKNDLTPANKIGEVTLNSVDAATTADAKTTWTPTETGSYKIIAQTTINVGGQDKVMSGSTNLVVGTAADFTKVVLDTAHANAYVSGYYAGSDKTLLAMLNAKNCMVIQNKAPLTAQVLDGAKVLILTDPQSKDDTAKSLNRSVYTAEEIQAIRDFVNAGGSVIIAGRADYDDKGIPVGDTDYHSAAQSNAVLVAIGSNLRLNDDEVIDDVANGGQNYRLYFSDYTGSKYNLTQNVLPGEKYSFYSGCSVIPKDGADLSQVDWLVKGNSTTKSLDSDNMNDAAAVNEGNVYALAAETLPSGGKVIVAGTVFFSDFETASGDNAYTNKQITDNILTWLTAADPAPVQTVADIRSNANSLGQRVAVEGIVTAQSKAVGANTAFFDVIYVQDATGGITVFGVTDRAIALGTKVRVTGIVDQYQGDLELRVGDENGDIAILDANPTPVAPKILQTAASMLPENAGWLVQTEGVVTRFDTGNGDNSLYINDGSGEARVYVDGYVGDGTGNQDMLGKWNANIKVGDKVSVIGLASKDAIGQRLRVRNTGEIVLLPTQGDMDPVQLDLSFDKRIVEVGEKATAVLTTRAAQNIYGFDLYLKYDPQLFELKSVVPNADFSLGAAGIKQDTNGNVHILGVLKGQSTGQDGDIKLITLNLIAKTQDALGSVSVLAGSKFSDSNGALATVDQDLTQNIAIANSDATGNGKLEINDLVMLARLFGSKALDAGYVAKLDINKDGIIDIVDIAYVGHRLLAQGLQR